MSVKNYRFVSPGVFINEIDNSQMPASPAGIGPVIIGRAAKGPALRPTTVSSFSEFIRIFGNPAAGASGDDVWREGSSTQAPTYGAYAAQAYLRNSSPLTFIRLLGVETTDGTVSGEGEAGWKADNAYGLFIFESGSGAEHTTASGSVTGALAAIFYTNDNASPSITGSSVCYVPDLSAWSPTALDGPLPYGGTVGTASTDPLSNIIGRAGFQSVLWTNLASNNYQFKMIMSGAYADNQHITASFNFDVNSSKYIRKVFNTNPQLMNAAITDASNRQNYFLGETFDRFLKANITPAQGITWAAIAKIYNTGSYGSGSVYNDSAQSAQTPWVVGCDLGDNRIPRLLKLHARGQMGDWTNRNIKISVQDVKQSTNESTDYGTFSVVVRKLSDSDNVVVVLEQFNDCNLNPESLNYVCRKIGDKYLSWREDERRYQEVGDYDNRSDFIRVEVAGDVDGAVMNAMYLPFGFEGIIKYKDDTGASVIYGCGEGGAVASTNSPAGNWATGSEAHIAGQYPPDNFFVPGALGGMATTGSVFVVSGSRMTASVLFPAPELRVNASAGGLGELTDAYFGFQTTRTTAGTVYDASTIDLLRPRGALVANMFAGVTGSVNRSVQFTLDDISGSLGTWISGSRAESGATVAGTSLSAMDGAISGVLDAGFDRFTIPMFGGFDGLNIDEMNPFRNNVMGQISSITDQNSYQYNSIRRAIDSTSDPEVVQMNLLSMPALTHEGLTTNMIRVCEDRADSLAVIDLPDGFTPRAESTVSARNNTASTIRQAIANLRARGLNSSYACTFYPWVRARDTISGQLLWLPPSVAAIGTFSSSQRKTQVWFAPAGFNRGGLTEGAAGIPVVDVAHRLRRKDRDDLYAANINPIAKFPAEGIVIFGQKTLQVTPSALDRINVRRLMLFIKKRISQMASTILFDPNVATTWARFTSMVDPFLADVKTNFGLTEYRVVLDETTTTADLIDRNILYAKIFLKPTRAIEYIAIDFNITRTGASFDD